MCYSLFIVILLTLLTCIVSSAVPVELFHSNRVLGLLVCNIGLEGGKGIVFRFVRKEE